MSVVPSGTVWQPRRDFGVIPGASSSSSSSASVASLQDSKPSLTTTWQVEQAHTPPHAVIEAGFDAFGDVEDTAGQAVVPVRNFFRVNLDGFAAGEM